MTVIVTCRRPARMRFDLADSENPHCKGLAASLVQHAAHNRAKWFYKPA